MLEIVRKPKGAGIVIIAPSGEVLRFYVNEVTRNGATMGFAKFQGFQVWRAEIYQKMQEEKNLIDNLPQSI